MHVDNGKRRCHIDATCCLHQQKGTDATDVDLAVAHHRRDRRRVAFFTTARALHDPPGYDAALATDSPDVPCATWLEAACLWVPLIAPNRITSKGDGMAKSDDFFVLLRSHGLRKKVAKPLAALDGNGRRRGVAGEKLARQTVDDLTSAVDEIHKRVLKRDRNRSQAARKAAQTRKRNASKRTARSRRGAETRSKVAATRARAKKQNKSRR